MVGGAVAHPAANPVFELSLKVPMPTFPAGPGLHIDRLPHGATGDGWTAACGPTTRQQAVCGCHTGTGDWRGD
jgi:hypothetical protein